MNSGVLQWSGCAFGLAGSLLMAANRSFSRWGWCAYLCSNTAWIGYAIATGTWGLFFEQLGYVSTGLFGLWRWFGRAPGSAPQVQNQKGRRLH